MFKTSSDHSQIINATRAEKTYWRKVRQVFAHHVLTTQVNLGRVTLCRIFAIYTAIKLSLLWVIFLAETSKDLEIILIITVLSFTNILSRTSFDFSLKTSFVYSNLFSLAKTVTIRIVTALAKLKRLFVKLSTVIMRICHWHW